MPTEYGVRPYAEADKKKTPYVDTIKAPSWAYALAQSVQKHSEMMKPYLDENDYPGMEANYPRYSFDRPRDWDDTVPNNFSPNTTMPCILTCWDPMYCDDPVECHWNVACWPQGMSESERKKNFSWRVKWKPNGKGNWVTYSNWEYFGDIVVTGDRQTIEAKTETSEPVTILVNTKVKEMPFGANINPLQIAAPTGGWSSWPDEPMDAIRVEMTDPCGAKCFTELNVFCRRLACCDDPATPTFTFDDASTPDTIAKGGSITVYTTGGCPPFTWSESCTDYSFASATTDGNTNTLSLANNACNNNSYCTFTITDSCGSAVSGTVVRTDGYWGGCSGGVGPCGFPTDSGCSATWTNVQPSALCLAQVRCCNNDDANGGPTTVTWGSLGTWYCTPCGAYNPTADTCPGTNGHCADNEYGWRC